MAAAFLMLAISPYSFKPRIRAALKPSSCVPPWGVTTVLQYEWQKPFSSSGQVIAHSTLPSSFARLASPEKGLRLMVVLAPT